MKFYSVQIRQIIEVQDKLVEVIIMRNGKKAAQAIVEKDGKNLKLIKILGKEEIKRLGVR